MIDYLMGAIAPIILASTTTGTTNNLPPSPSVNVQESTTEDVLSGKEAELDLMWDKIQELKEKDSFAAQVLYERYKRLAGDIPPPTPSDIA